MVLLIERPTVICMMAPQLRCFIMPVLLNRSCCWHSRTADAAWVPEATAGTHQNISYIQQHHTVLQYGTACPPRKGAYCLSPQLEVKVRLSIIHFHCLVPGGASPGPKGYGRLFLILAFLEVRE